MAPRPPLIVNGPAPRVLPAYPLPGSNREGRPLYVTSRAIIIDGQWIPEGYVTDFGSIPWLARWRINPLDRHAWAALKHDWRYAIGEPGKRPFADDGFRERLEIDGVFQVRRTAMYRSVQIGGAGGYAKAKTWWETENFADPETGDPVAPPFARELAFDGQPFGLQA